MLSYQHIYHAGNKADLHKHAILAQVLDAMTRHPEPAIYIETHAGRGLYDLRADEALKTGEACEGWLAEIKNLGMLRASYPASYVDAVQAMNAGDRYEPFYPGSPLIAAHILRSGDRLHLAELHPREHEALTKACGRDRRIAIYREDGLKKALDLCKAHAGRTNGLILIDPSYELKDEYETVPAALSMMRAAWPEAAILLWIPMLQAGRHEKTLERLKALGDFQISQKTWPPIDARPGMFGSIMAGFQLPIDL